MSEHTTNLQDRFADAAMELLMDAYAQEEGMALLQRCQKEAVVIPEAIERNCQKIMQKAYKQAPLVPTLKRAARTAACILIALTLTFQVVMHVEALRIPVLNFLLKQEKTFSEIAFSQSESSFTALDQLRLLIWTAVPEGYRMEEEIINTDKFLGTERVSTVLIRFVEDQGGILDISVTKAAGTVNIDSQDAAVTQISLSGQQAVYVEKEEELRVLWINEPQGQMYSVQGYGVGSDAFWECANILSEATRNTLENISF